GGGTFWTRGKIPASPQLGWLCFSSSLLLLPLVCSCNGIFSVNTSNHDCTIWRVGLQRVRWLQHRECVGRNKQQPEHECDNRWFIRFHTRTLSMSSFSCHGAYVGSCGATQERIAIPSFGL